MRRRLNSLLALLCFFALGPGCASDLGGSEVQVAPGQNLIVNPEFENVDGGAPSGWTFEARASQKGVASVSRTKAHAGQNSLKLEPNQRNRPWDIANNPLSMGQAFPAGPFRGKTLRVSGWLSAEGPAVAVAGLYGLKRDGGVAFVRLEQGSSPKEFVFHENSLLVPNDPSVQYVILNLAVEGTEGAAYFDDVAVSLEGPKEVARAAAGPQHAEIVVRAKGAGRVIPRTLYGSNLEWIWNANGAWDPDRQQLNPEVVRLTRDAGISLLRFPGGVFADFYQWRDGVGPRSSRRQTPHYPGAPSSVHAFGTDEALAFAAATNAELLVTVNAGTGTAQQAADWVTYVNRDPNRRPRVKYWEIGNELYIKDPKFVSISPTVYAERVVEFARAMRRADPSIKIAAISDENYPSSVRPAYPDWTDELLRRGGSEIDYLAVHNAYAPMMVADRDFGVREVYTAMLAAPVLIRRNLDELTRRLDAFNARAERPVKIAVTEWGPFFHFDVKNRFVDHVKTLGSALFAASTLKVFLESPAVDIANAFKLVDPLFMGWIGLRDGQYAPTAPYLALQMFTRHFGDQLVPSETQSPSFDSPAIGWVDRVTNAPLLDVVASRSADGRTLFVLAINRDLDRPITARISLADFDPASTATAWVLNGSGIDAHTGTEPAAAAGVARQASGGRFDRGGPNEVTLTSATVSGVSPAFEYTFPAHSVTSLQIQGR